MVGCYDRHRGLPDAAVKESRDRVTTALTNSGFKFLMGRGAVNLAPFTFTDPITIHSSTTRGQAPLMLPKWRVSRGKSVVVGSGQTGLPERSR
jgi:Subunit ChlI of Mg-chelatase